MKIVAVRIDRLATGHYRITNPGIALENLGHEIDFITAEGQRINAGQFRGDILWLQRRHSMMYLDLVASLPAGSRPKVIYDIDDYFWDAHVNRVQLGSEETKAEVIKKQALPVIAACDAVTCSTPELAAIVRPINPNVYIVPNAIDFHFRDWVTDAPRPEEAQGKIVIGWSGGAWHEGDFDGCGKALRDTLLAHPECHFIGQGDAGVVSRWVLQMRLPRRRCCVVDRFPFDTHPSAYGLFDIGIAPLAPNAYNRCKSELKLMELGAKGLPYVATRIAPYNRFHKMTGGNGGCLVGSYKEWREGLEVLICNEQERRARGRAASACAKEHYDLRDRALQLERIFKGVLNGP